MKNWNVILGVDVSKLTLDISCAAHNLHLKIENSSKVFGLFKKWCNRNAFDLKETLVVLEFTGGYGEEKIKRLTPSKPLNVNMIMLKQLLSFRKRLVRERAGLDSTLKERKHMYGVNNTDLVIRIILGKIKSNNKYIQM